MLYKIEYLGEKLVFIHQFIAVYVFYAVYAEK